MKKSLAIFCLVAISLTSHARRYTQDYGSCTFKATVQDMFNDERDLPFTFDVEYMLAFDSETGEYVGQKALVIPQVNATSDVSPADIQDIVTGINFTSDGGINMDLNSDQVGTIIAYAGDYRAIYNSHTLPSVTGEFAPGENFCVQSHMDPQVDYGVSYHICGVCDITDSPTQGRP